MIFGVEQGTGAVLRDHVSEDDIIVTVLVGFFPDGLPAPQITPVAFIRDQYCIIGFFHDCIIDGILGALRE